MSNVTTDSIQADAKNKPRKLSSIHATGKMVRMLYRFAFQYKYYNNKEAKTQHAIDQAHNSIPRHVILWTHNAFANNDSIPIPNLIQ